MSNYSINKQSDNVWCRASKVIAAPTDTTHVVCPIPKSTLITDIIVNKSTAYTDVGALVNIGFSGNGETADPDAFMSSAVFDPAQVGVVSMKQGSVKNSGGKYFTSAGSITVTSDDNGGTAGTFQVFVCYTQIKS